MIEHPLFLLYGMLLLGAHRVSPNIAAGASTA